jgi:hypothetical protein
MVLREMAAIVLISTLGILSDRANDSYLPYRPLPRETVIRRLSLGSTAPRRRSGCAEAGMTSFANRSRSSSCTSSGAPSGGCANHPIEAGIALLDRFQLLDDVLRVAGDKGPGVVPPA